MVFCHSMVIVSNRDGARDQGVRNDAPALKKVVGRGGGGGVRGLSYTCLHGQSCAIITMWGRDVHHDLSAHKQIKIER